MKRDDLALRWQDLVELRIDGDVRVPTTQICIQLPNDKIVPAGYALTAVEDDDPDNHIIVITAAKTITPRPSKKVWVKAMRGPVL